MEFGFGRPYARHSSSANGLGSRRSPSPAGETSRWTYITAPRHGVGHGSAACPAADAEVMIADPTTRRPIGGALVPDDAKDYERHGDDHGSHLGTSTIG